MTQQFRVVTYNILSSHLADSARFPECEPGHLDAEVRLKRVMAKLKKELAKLTVVCLQEVSTCWVGKLHVFFQQHGYIFVTSNYGNKFNGYMGVGIAWPLHTYEAMTVDVTRISDTRKWGRPPQEDSPPAQAATKPGAWTHPGTWVGDWGRPIELFKRLTGRGTKRKREADGENSNGQETEKQDHWQMAERRFNQAIFVRLRPKGSAALDAFACSNANCEEKGSGQNGAPSLPSGTNGVLGADPSARCFCIGTYHMPCLFNYRPVMMIHTSMAIKHLARLARKDPLVFAGDFNFNPQSECYKLVTEGDLDDSSPDYPERPAWEKDWSATTGVPLMSAYKEVNGTEPDFTNNAKVEDWPPFIDTLDYIFHTPGVRAISVLPLGHRDEIQGPFPSEAEPSDHVILAAVYEVKAESTKGAGTLPLQAYAW